MKLWKKIWQHPFIMVMVVVLVTFIFSAYKYRWDWTGFSDVPSKKTTVSMSGGTIIVTEVQLSKTLWDWFNLLGIFAIPAAVAWYTMKQGKMRDAEIKDNQNEDIFREYMEYIENMTKRKGLYASKEYDQIRYIASMHTLSVLSQLDGKRKGKTIRFLFESGLINANECIIDLREADLTNANLTGVFFVGADLSGTNLTGADLSKSTLWSVDFSGAKLINANLSDADLHEAVLRGANLAGVKLNEADLSEADLEVITGITVEKLESTVKSLKDAIMPDGTIHS
jgi:hypothetical protein